MTRKRIKWYCLLAACAAAALLGNLSAKPVHQEPAGADPNPRISLSTKFGFVCRYRYCGHEVALEKDRYIGMDQEDFREAEPGVLIRRFSAEEVSAELTVNQYCPKHSIVCLIDGMLCVVSAEAGSDVPVLRRQLGITEDRIDEKYLESLQKGMVVTAGRTADDIMEMVLRKPSGGE